MKNIKLILAVALAVSALATFWALNASESQGYAAPEDLCGIPIAGSSIEPLLPSGDELEHEEPEVDPPPAAIIHMCRVSVDRETVLSLNIRSFESPTPDLMENYRATPRAYGIVSPYEDTVGGEYAILDNNGSLVETDCPVRGPDAVLQFNIKNHVAEGDPEEGRELMKNFTEDFMESAKTEYGC